MVNLRLYRSVYRRVYRKVSGPMQARCFVGCFVSVCAAPACGVQGALVDGSSTPCLWAFPWQPLENISRATDARTDSLRPKGKGSAPAPQRSSAAGAARLALRWREVKLSIPCCVGVGVLLRERKSTSLFKQPLFLESVLALSGKGIRCLTESGTFCDCRPSAENRDLFVFPQMPWKQPTGPRRPKNRSRYFALKMFQPAFLPTTERSKASQ